MSVHVITWVLEHSEAKLGDRLVLIVLADHAKKDGAGSWPSIETIGRESRLSERQVQRCLKNLADSGEIVLQGQSRAGTKVWTLARYQLWLGGDNMAPGGGDISVAKHDRMSSEPLEPLYTPPTPPSGEVREIYDHWREVRGKSRVNYWTMSVNRGRRIRSRLKEFTSDELKQAIDFVALDPWTERKNHDDLTTIFRSREQVDRFLELGEGSKRKASPVVRARKWVEGSGWEYPDADLIEELVKRFGIEDSSERSLLVEIAHELQRAAA